MVSEANFAPEELIAEIDHLMADWDNAASMTWGKLLIRCRAALEASHAPVPRDDLWLHVKTGKVYRVIAHAHIEADPDDVVVIYAAPDQPLWVWSRPYAEFYDGRFVRYDAAAGTTPEPVKP